MDKMRLVRAVYDFVTDVPGEISLRNGDLVIVIAVINADWLRGCCCDKREGIFPASFVEDVPLPPLENGLRLFVAEEEFSATHAEDLGFKKGEVVVGLRPVDANWWSGRGSGGAVGMFPVTFTTPLPFELGSQVPLSRSSSSTPSSAPGERRSLVCTGGSKAAAAAAAAATDGREQERPGDVSGGGCHPFRVRAQVASVAQLHEELGFGKDDIITVTRILDDDWYCGECNGKRGIFLSSLVERLQTHAAEAHGFGLEGEGSSSGGGSGNVPRAKSGDRRTKEATGKGTKAASAGPTAQHLLPQCAPPAPKTSSPVTAYVVLHDFLAEAPGEISLSRGDAVTVLRSLSGGWCEVSLGSSLGGEPPRLPLQRGLCPLAYLGVPAAASDGGAAVASAADSRGSKRALLPGASSSGGRGGLGPAHASQAQLRPRAADAAASAARRSWSPACSLDEVVASEIAKLKAKPLVPARPPFLGSALLSSSTASLRSAGRGASSRPTSIGAKKSGDTDVVMTSAAGADPVVTGDASVECDAIASEAVQSDAAASCSAYSAEPAVAAEAMFHSTVEGGDDVTAEEGQSSDAAAAAATADLVDAVVDVSAAGDLPSGAEMTASFSEASASADRTSEALVAVTAGPTRPALPPPPLHRTSSAAKLMPSRPAPPVPQARSSSVPSLPAASEAAEAAKATMPLVAPVPAHDMANDASQHAVDDLKNRIALLESDIKKMTIELKSVQQDGTSMSPDMLKETVDFYLSNINGMTAELMELEENLKILAPCDESAETSGSGPAVAQHLPVVEISAADSSADRQNEKMKEQRLKVIDEIRTTEDSYLRDLQLSIKYFTSPETPKHPDVDAEMLFGNMEDVAAVSQKFLSRFEDCVTSKPFQEQCAGLPFIQLAEDMKDVYSVYCRNHDDVCMLLERYEEDESIQAYFNKVLDMLRIETVVFDVGSFLIKPVQRILKYPLLLRELLKCTEDTHPDKVILLQAVDAVTDVASAINEYKRRKDLVYKYRKEKYATLTDKMALLNMHSLRKKSARLGTRLTATLGLSNQTRDLDFEREEATFRGLERSIKAFLKNVVSHLQLLEKTVSAQEQLAASIRELYLDKPADTVAAYVKTQQTLVAEIFKNFRSSVDINVLFPLTKLTAYYQGPSNVIQKRGDKLLDYDNCQSAFEKVRETDQAKAAKDELLVAQKDYEALNQQLLVELPKLNLLSSLILNDGISYYVNVYRQYLNAILAVMYPLLQMPQLSTQGRQVMESFSTAHETVAAILTRLCSGAGAALSPAMPRPASQSLLGIASQQQKATPMLQTAEQRQQLIAKYSVEQLYVVYSLSSGAIAGSASASNDMDLAVVLGQLVAVLKTKDPMGNSTKWFVDGGSAKGFVPSQNLQPFVGEGAATDAGVGRASSASSPPASSPPATSPPATSPPATSPPASSPPVSSPPASPRVPDVGLRHRLSDAGASSASVQPAPDEVVLRAASPRLVMRRVDQASSAAAVARSQRVSESFRVAGSAPRQGYLLPPVADCAMQVQQQPSLPPKSPPSPPVCVDVEYWYAMYAFSARNSNEASLVAGQPVAVLQKNDASGNASWWLVECCDRCGYVPSNYLATYKPQRSDLPPPYR